MGKRVERSEEEWRRLLSDEEYEILRNKATERPFTGEYWDEKTSGVYRCRGCGTPLFSSGAKYDSKCGWPSFFRPLAKANIRTELDHSHRMVRTEVLCATCDGHLGHLFPDGPRPTGLRYCINSASLRLEPGVDETVRGQEREEPSEPTDSSTTSG